jgi:hypothetical protein
VRFALFTITFSLIELIYTGIVFFSYLTDFGYFTLKIVFWKLLYTVGTGQIWPFWKRVWMVSAIFHWFQLFYFLTRIIPDLLNLFVRNLLAGWLFGTGLWNWLNSNIVVLIWIYQVPIPGIWFPSAKHVVFFVFSECFRWEVVVNFMELYLSVDLIFQSLWFLSGFPW